MTLLQKLLFSRFMIFRRLMVSAAWLFTSGLVTWHLLRLYLGDRLLPVRLGNFFIPWLLMALFPALIVASLSGQVWLMRLIILLVIVMGKSYGHLLIEPIKLIEAITPASPPHAATIAAPDALKLMTFNINYRNNKVAAIAELIRSEKPDIIAFQEMSETIAPSLEAALVADYPYRVIDRGEGSLQALMSRYPITEQPAPPAIDIWRTMRATINTPTGAVTIWNVHTRVPLKQHLWQAQRNALTAVAEEIKTTVGPLIVLGDFNTTAQTENYQLVATHLTDVHQVVGRGFGFTFPHGLKRAAGLFIFGPLVRIDLVFASHHFLPQNIRVMPKAYGSDHRPVVATLQWVNLN